MRRSEKRALEKELAEARQRYAAAKVALDRNVGARKAIEDVEQRRGTMRAVRDWLEGRGSRVARADVRIKIRNGLDLKAHLDDAFDLLAPSGEALSRVPAADETPDPVWRLAQMAESDTVNVDSLRELPESLLRACAVRGELKSVGDNTTYWFRDVGGAVVALYCWHASTALYIERVDIDDSKDIKDSIDHPWFGGTPCVLPYDTAVPDELRAYLAIPLAVAVLLEADEVNVARDVPRQRVRAQPKGDKWGHRVVVAPHAARKFEQVRRLGQESRVRLHSVRSHGADYTSGKGLFGRLRLLVNRRAHVRGDAALGILHAPHWVVQNVKPPK